MSLFSRFAYGDLIDPKDGSLIWYPRGLLKEGYQLEQGQRRKIERGMWLAIALALICLLIPFTWLRLRLETFAGPTAVFSLLVVMGAVALLVFLDLLYWRPRRIAKASQRRPPDCRPRDVDWIHKRIEDAGDGLPLSFWLLLMVGTLAGHFMKWATSN